MPAHELSYRLAGSDDVDPVVALVDSAYRGDTSRLGWTTEADLLDGQRTDAAAVAEVLAAPDSRLLVAEAADGRLMACCQIDRREGGVAYFGMFAVRPGTQGQGIGRAVLAEAERLAGEELGATVMRMAVIRQRSALIAWYGRLGYSPTGERQPFPYGDERYGKPQRDDLEFVILERPLGAGR